MFVFYKDDLLLNIIFNEMQLKHYFKGYFIQFVFIQFIVKDSLFFRKLETFLHFFLFKDNFFLSFIKDIDFIQFIVEESLAFRKLEKIFKFLYY